MTCKLPDREWTSAMRDQRPTVINPDPDPSSSRSPGRHAEHAIHVKVATVKSRASNVPYYSRAFGQCRRPFFADPTCLLPARAVSAAT